MSTVIVVIFKTPALLEIIYTKEEMEEQVKSKATVDDELAAALEPSADEPSMDSADSDGDVRSSSSASLQTSRRHHVDHNGLVYFTRMPRHERRRIQLQVRKNRKPGQLRLIVIREACMEYYNEGFW